MYHVLPPIIQSLTSPTDDHPIRRQSIIPGVYPVMKNLMDDSRDLLYSLCALGCMFVFDEGFENFVLGDWNVGMLEKETNEGDYVKSEKYYRCEENYGEQKMATME